MNYLTLENVSKIYGDKVLFDQVTLQINKGQKIAMVAKNGSGKSTLLRIAAGLEPSEGENSVVRLHRDVRFAFLDQDPHLYPHHNVLEAVLDSDEPMVKAVRRYEKALLHPDDQKEIQAAIAEMEDHKAWDLEARVKEVLTRFRITDYERPVRLLSGGQQKRIALVRLIISEPEFVILDEPTNHLDLDMIEWLEEYLRRPNLTLLMVTHDRYFLERVCNTIIELDHGQLYRYNGNYADFLNKKATRTETEGAEREKLDKLLQRELEWVNRSPQARTTKAKSRVDAFYDLKDRLGNHRVEEEMSIDIKGQRLGKKVLECHNIGKRFGDIPIVEGFSYKFRPYERAGIVGPNGVGKTTFLKMLTKEVRPDSGKIVLGDNTIFGYYTQDGINLPNDKRVIDVIQDIAEYIPLEKGQKLTAPQVLERFLFNRKQQQVYVSQLSGGERRRLYLLTILMENPNFLILDEPTNDLDILTLNVLEDFLLEFPGCVLIVTHDRYFMDKVVEHLFVFEGNGVIKDFNGTYSEYREQQKERDREQRRLERAEQQKAKEEQKVQEEAKPGLSFEQRKELNRLEREIRKLEEKKAAITEQFNSSELTTEKIKELSVELSSVNEQIEEREMRWMELAELG